MAIVFFGFSVSCVQEEVDNDIWWHLKTGKYLIEHMEGGLPVFPVHDVFSQSGADKEWANHEWLADMLMYAVYDVGGLRTLIFMKAILFSGLFILIFFYAKRRSGDMVLSGLITILAVLTSQWTAYTRPPVFTYVFIAIYLHLLWNLEDGKRRALPIWAALSLLMVPWVNLHGGAILGIVVMVLWMAGLFVESLLAHWRYYGFPAARAEHESLPEDLLLKDRLVPKPDWSWLRRFIPALALVGLASLANPFGLDIHRLTFKVMGDILIVRTNSELQPPELIHTSSFDAYVIVLLVVVLLLLLRRQSRFRAADLLLVGFFLFQAASHVRHLPLFALTAAGPLSVWLMDLTGSRSEERAATRLSRLIEPLVQYKAWIYVLVLINLLVFIHTGFYEARFFRHVRYWQNPLGYDPRAYPAEACEFVIYVDTVLGRDKAYGTFPDNLFNTINYSGYLIWRLSPEYHKVFTDSRFDIHGSEYLRDVLSVENVLPVALPFIDSATPDTPEMAEERRKRIELVQRGSLTPYWQEILDRRGIGFMIIQAEERKRGDPQGPSLFDTLKNGDRGWALVYYDRHFAIFVRDIAPNKTFINEVRKIYAATHQGWGLP